MRPTEIAAPSAQEAPAMHLDRATMIAFVSMVIIGGANFVVVKFSNEELAPFYGAAVRFMAASLILFGWVAAKRIRLPRGRSLLGVLIYGILSFTGAYALAYMALLELSVGVAAIVMASVPLITLLFASAHRLEAFRIRGMVGALIAIGGIAVITGTSDAQIHFPSLMMMIGAAVCAAESGVVIKRFPSSNPVATNAVAMGVGTTFLFLLSALVDERWTVPTETTTWLSVSYLVLLGSVGLFGLYLFTLRGWTASGVSYMFVITPVIAAVAGSVLASEPITKSLVIGGAVTLSGVYVGALSGEKRA